MKVLSLFSGGGLGDLGLELAGMQIVGQVEIDSYCQKILNLRWPHVPKWKDIREVRGKEIIDRCGTVELISGGFPCQPFSTAGNMLGSDHNEYLWPEMLRVIKEIKPAFIFSENVSGINGSELGSVLFDLESEGYDFPRDIEGRPIIFEIPACAFGAWHARNRVWIIANNEKSNDGTNYSQKSKGQIQKFGNCFEPSTLSDAFSVGGKRRASMPEKEKRERTYAETSGHSWWASEPGLGRLVYGRSGGMVRLKLLGNGQVVYVVKWLAEKIMSFKAQKYGG